MFDMPLFQKQSVSAQEAQEAQEQLTKDKRSFFIFKPCQRCDRRCQTPVDCTDMTHAWSELQRWASVQRHQKGGDQ
jgi:hypothetical protein